MLPMIVAGICLMVLCYFAVLCCAEVLWWVRDRVPARKPVLIHQPRVRDHQRAAR